MFAIYSRRILLVLPELMSSESSPQKYSSTRFMRAGRSQAPKRSKSSSKRQFIALATERSIEAAERKNFSCNYKPAVFVAAAEIPREWRRLQL